MQGGLAALQEQTDRWFGDAGGGPLLPRSAGRLTVSGAGIASREVNPKNRYLVQRELVEDLLAPGPPGFVLSHFSHGMNSSAWTLWHRRPGLRFCGQVHAGGAFARSEDTAEGMRRLVELYERCVLLAPEVDGDLVLLTSALRGVWRLGVLPRTEPFSRRRQPDDDAPGLDEITAAAGLQPEHLAAEWVDRRRRLTIGVETALDGLGAGGLELTDERYLQWAAWPEGLQIEASSDAHLEQEPLGFVARRGLDARDWHPPQPPEFPNHWQRFETPVDVDAAVDALLAAARTLLTDAHHPDQGAAGVLPGRRILVVPVFKCGAVLVQDVAEAITLAAPNTGDPVVQIDLMGVLADAHDAPTPFHQLHADEHLSEGEVRTVDARGLVRDVDHSGLLRSAATVLDMAEALTTLGRHVVVVGPWCLPGRHDVPVYAALAAGRFDAVVLVVGDQHPEAGEIVDGLVQHLLGDGQITDGPPAVVLGPDGLGRRSRRILSAVPYSRRRTSAPPPQLAAAVWQVADRGGVL